MRFSGVGVAKETPGEVLDKSPGLEVMLGVMSGSHVGDRMGVITGSYGGHVGGHMVVILDHMRFTSGAYMHICIYCNMVPKCCS